MDFSCRVVVGLMASYSIRPIPPAFEREGASGRRLFAATGGTGLLITCRAIAVKRSASMSARQLTNAGALKCSLNSP